MLAAGFGGVLATCTDVTTLMVLVKLVGLPIPVSAFLAATVGAVVVFVANKYIAFRDHSPITLDQVGRFAFVAITNAVVMALAMKLVAVELGVPVLPAKLICAAVVFVAWTYPAQRRLVFHRSIAPDTAARAEPSPAASLA